MLSYRHPSSDRTRGNGTKTAFALREALGTLRSRGVTAALSPRDWTAAAGGVDLTIGARGAVWAPATGLASIVVLDEHDEALQEERNPTWHARDVAVERARRGAIPCLLVSPVPSLAALAWSAGRVAVPSRDDERAGWPLVEVDDRSQEEPWVTSPVSSRLVAHLRDRRLTVVCVLNSTGRAKRLVCRTCSQATVCERCGAAVEEADG